MTDEIRQATDKLRDLHNWVAVFDTEYDLPKEVVQQLRDRLEDVAKALGQSLL